MYYKYMSHINQIQLEKISTIFAGHAFRTALQKEPDGNICVLQAKNVREGLDINLQTLPCIQMNYDGERILQGNDVILSSRGFFKAAVFDSDIKTIAAASTYILRCNISKILPEYLAIYLNSKKGQNQLAKYGTSTTIKSILVKDLQNITISLPSRESQKIIVDLYKCKNKHKKLLNKKELLHEQIFEEVIKNITI